MAFPGLEMMFSALAEAFEARLMGFMERAKEHPAVIGAVQSVESGVNKVREIDARLSRIEARQDEILLLLKGSENVGQAIGHAIGYEDGRIALPHGANGGGIGGGDGRSDEAGP